MYYLVMRVVALMLLLQGADIGRNAHHWWQFPLSIVIFLAGVEWFSSLTIRDHEHKKMPYRWHCSNCHTKKHPCEFASNSEEVLQKAKEHHNRTVHLMEP